LRRNRGQAVGLPACPKKLQTVRAALPGTKYAYMNNLAYDPMMGNVPPVTRAVCLDVILHPGGGIVGTAHLWCLLGRFHPNGW
jgi:hypothetical protein